MRAGAPFLAKPWHVWNTPGRKFRPQPQRGRLAAMRPTEVSTGRLAAIRSPVERQALEAVTGGAWSGGCEI